jgi:NADH dehydrogenase
VKVTIVGAGFAGVKAALELAKDRSFEITVITDKPDFQYYPSLFSTATGRSHLESWVPLGEIFGGHDNIKVHIDRVIGIDAENRTLVGISEAEYHYETCIIAIGTVTTYFGIPGLDQYSYGIKSAAEIRRLKERIYQDLGEKRELDKNYVVVGGGPTGVELAGALGTYLKRLAKYHGIRRLRVNVRLIEAAPRILPRSHERSSKKAVQRLNRLGVSIQTGVALEKETAESIIVAGRPVASHTVVWTAGVMNNPLFAAHPSIFTLAPNGRVVVDAYMRVNAHVYVLGDNAATPYTGLAQTALHDAKFVAANLKRHRRGIAMQQYKPIIPASSIPIGRRWAIFEWRGIRLYGLVAAILRRCADFVGYTDILPIGQALRPWHASTIFEQDYFAPQSGVKPSRKKRRKL